MKSGNHGNEKYEISLKKNNVVIHSLEEYDAQNDINQVINLNKAIGNEDFSNNNILRIYRIGRKYGDKSRPLKVELDSHVTKLNIMRNACQLKHSGHYGHISIQHDLTKIQTIEFKKVKQESRRLEEGDQIGNCKYRVRGPPGRWEIVKLPKN